MNLAEFLAAADELFGQRRIELWVVGTVPERLRCDNRYRATRFLGYVEDLAPIFDMVRIGIVAEKTGGGFKMKSLDYIFSRVPVAAIAGSLAGLALIANRDYLSFETIDELAWGIAAAVDDIGRLNALHQAAYERCRGAFDWSDRGRTLLTAMREATARDDAKVSLPRRSVT
jgi:glycosyltransferase involved in cell wall biosynthesis